MSKSRNDQLAVQSSHTGEPLRLGGVAAVVGLLLGLVVLITHSTGAFTLMLLASLLPVFFAGLWEDLGYGVSARHRFLASVVSAIIAIILLELWVWRGNLPVLDSIMGFAPTGIVVSIFVAACYCHAVNLVDGMNGLAATIVIISALGLALIAGHEGQAEIANLATLLATATLGFHVLNWPSAKMFLGDAGAYGLGHILVWLAISLVALAPEVAVPALLLVLFYPIVDTVHTVLRRLRSGKKVTEPDRMHLHQKIRRALEIVWIGRGRRHISNPITTLVLLPMIGAPVLAGVVLWNQPVWSWIFLAGFSALFAGLHVLITALAKRFRATLQDKPNSRASVGEKVELSDVHFFEVSAQGVLAKHPSSKRAKSKAQSSLISKGTEMPKRRSEVTDRHS